MSLGAPFDLPPEQISAAAWYGPDMSKRDDWLMTLSGTEIAEIEGATKALARREADIAAACEANSVGSSVSGRWSPSARVRSIVTMRQRPVRRRCVNHR